LLGPSRRFGAEEALGALLRARLDVGHPPGSPQVRRHDSVLAGKTDVAENQSGGQTVGLLGGPVAAGVGLALLLAGLALLLLVVAALAGTGELGAHDVAEGGAAGGAGGVALGVGELRRAIRALDREADLPLHRVDGDDLDLHVLARLEERPRILDA